MADHGSGADIPRVQKCVAVFWPSFLTAGVATVLLFAVFDPIDVLVCAGIPEFSRIGAYSIGFFFFWAVTAVSCLLSMYFSRPCPMTKAPPRST